MHIRGKNLNRITMYKYLKDTQLVLIYDLFLHFYCLKRYFYIYNNTILYSRLRSR